VLVFDHALKLTKSCSTAARRSDIRLRMFLLSMSLALFTFRAIHTKEGCMIHVSRMKRDTPFQTRVCSIKMPGFKDLTCLACRLCSQRRSRAMERSRRRKRKKASVYHLFASELNMSLAISKGIGLSTTSSVTVAPNFGMRSWKRAAGCTTSECG